MRFGQVEYFWYALLSAIGLGIFYLWVYKSRSGILEKVAQKALLKDLLSSLDLRGQYLKSFLLSLGLVLCVLSLGRPQWGFQWKEVKRKGLDILIALDTSKSMLAQDLKPSRIERSKLAIRDLVKYLKGDRIGLIAFSGSAFLQCPLTVDYGGFLLSLEDIDTEIIPKGGTNLSSAITEAVRSYSGAQKKYKVLVIITDGEDHKGNALSAAEEAKKEGIAVFCVGIGSREGELIPLKNEDGQTRFLKDRQGNVVKSRLDEFILQKIALATGGSYVRATGAEFGLELLYRERLSKLEKRELEGKLAKHYEERFQIPLALAFLLLLVELLISERKKAKDIFPSLGGRGRGRGKRAVLLTVFICWAGLAYAKDDAASLTAKANRLYKEGKYDQALGLYNRALISRPDSALLNFNIGAANYKKGDFENALKSFEKAALSEDKLLESKANYNSGNSQYKSAKLKENIDLEAAVNLMRQSLEHYKRAMELNNKDEDAKINHDLAEKELKALLEKLKQQPRDKQPSQNKGQCPNPQADSESKDKENGESQKQNSQTEKKEAQKAQGAEQKEARVEDKQPEQALKGAEEKPKEMSEQEARMLLEGRRQDESLGGQVRDGQKAEWEAVEKDW